MKQIKDKLIITSPQENKIESTRLQVDKYSTYLGITSRVNGKQLKQQEAIKNSAKALSKKSVTCHLNHCATCMYQAYFINPKLSYPLVASSLSEKQLHDIQRIIHSIVISSKGFNNHWSVDLRYSIND